MKSSTRILLATFAVVLGARATTPTPAAAASSPASHASIAVVVRPADPASKYIAAEYARDLVHLLGGAPLLRVAPRSRVLHAEASTAAPAELGRTLGVTHLLEATARLSGDSLEISVGLLEAQAGNKRWQQSYRSGLARASQLSAKISHDTLDALGLPTLSPNARERDVTTTNKAAWENYLRGRLALDTLTEPSLIEAIAHFERAGAADREFGAARVALATAHIALGYNFQNPRTHFTKARETLANLGRRGAPLAEALIDDAVLKFYHDWDWAGAARGATFTTQHDPSAVETHACFLHCAQTMGRLEEGLEQIAAAHRAHPESLAIRSELPCAAYYAGRLEDAERESRSALQADPENPLLYWSLARTLAQQGRFDAALAELKTAQSKPGGDWTGILSEIAYIHGRQKRNEAARDVIAQLRAREKTEYVDHYLHAMAFAGLGETAEVFRHLEQAAADRSTWIPSLALDPKFAALRGDSRFRALLDALKLPVR